MRIPICWRPGMLGDWFEAAEHYGIDAFVTMSPLEEAWCFKELRRPFEVHRHPEMGREMLRGLASPLEMFYNIGSRIIKFHMAPGTMLMRGWRFDTPGMHKIMREAADRGMILMSHVGDPDTWYGKKYDTAKYGTREEHYRLWEDCLASSDHPGRAPGRESRGPRRLQDLLDTYPNLYLDCSATRWMVREVSAGGINRDFFIRNRIAIFGSDQVSGDIGISISWPADSGVIASSGRRRMSFPARFSIRIFRRRISRSWRGLALPDGVLQKLYHDNVVKLLGRVGVRFGE